MIGKHGTAGTQGKENNAVSFLRDGCGSTFYVQHQSTTALAEHLASVSGEAFVVQLHRFFPPLDFEGDRPGDPLDPRATLDPIIDVTMVTRGRIVASYSPVAEYPNVQTFGNDVVGRWGRFRGVYGGG